MQRVLCKEYYAKNVMQEQLCEACYAHNIMHRIVGIEYFANVYDNMINLLYTIACNIMHIILCVEWFVERYAWILCTKYCT